MDIQEEILNSKLPNIGNILPVGGFFIRKEDVIFHPTSLWDKTEFPKLDFEQMTTMPNPGFSTSKGKNPFKPLSFSFDAQILGPCPAEVAEIVNFLLSSCASYKQVPYEVFDRFFHPALWCTRMLVSFLSGYDPKVWLHTGIYALGEKAVFYIPRFDGYPRYVCLRYEWQYFFWV